MGKKWASWFFLSLPGWVFLIIPALLHSFGDKLWKRFYERSGYIALSLFLFVLALNPLVRLFPKRAFFKKINRYRRAIGVASFYYALIHLTTLLINKIPKKGGISFSYFIHPVRLTGSFAFLILLVLTYTSFDCVIKKMGGVGWKHLHRTAYLAEALLFLHLFLQGEEQLLWAFILFVPLVFLQYKRWKPFSASSFEGKG